jgi:hypothetical protein
MSVFAYNELHIDAARWIREFHGRLRENLETCLGSQWHITKITESSTSTYEATLISLPTENPEYILTQVIATFHVEARENGALEQIVNGLKVSIPRKTLHFKAELMSNGHLRITESRLGIPQ